MPRSISIYAIWVDLQNIKQIQIGIYIYIYIHIILYIYMLYVYMYIYIYPTVNIMDEGKMSAFLELRLKFGSEALGLPDEFLLLGRTPVSVSLETKAGNKQGNFIQFCRC